MLQVVSGTYVGGLLTILVALADGGVSFRVRGLCLFFLARVVQSFPRLQYLLKPRAPADGAAAAA